jgi:hypothetical protein
MIFIREKLLSQSNILIVASSEDDIIKGYVG